MQMLFLPACNKHNIEQVVRPTVELEIYEPGLVSTLISRVADFAIFWTIMWGPILLATYIRINNTTYPPPPNNNSRHVRGLQDKGANYGRSPSL